MPRELFYRDPRNPRDVYGPCSADQLRELARQGRFHPTDQVSLDRRDWQPATEADPGLFPRESMDWFVARPFWYRSANMVANHVKTFLIDGGSFLKRVAQFYWTHRKDLRQLSTEYLTIFQQPGSRREIRVSQDDQKSPTVSFDGAEWQADLPDCCIVCGNLTSCAWIHERRNVLDLTWALLGPVLGLLIGTAGWVLLWSSSGRWLALAGLLGGFLIGYWRCTETPVTVRFRRCQDHLTRTKIPRLRIFHRSLIIGIGDRKVWRRFYHGDRDVETPLTVPPDLSEITAQKTPLSEPSDERPSYPTIRLVGDDEMSPPGEPSGAGV